MGNLQSWGEREILSGSEKSHIRLAHALERVTALGCHMCEITTREHIHRVLPRHLRKVRVSRKWPKSSRNSFVVHQVQHLGFQLRSRTQRRDCVGQGNSLV